MKRRRKTSDYIIDGVILFTMIFLLICIIYPFLNAAAISLNDSDDTARGGITFYPRIFTLKNYGLIFKNPAILRAYTITIGRTVIGTITGLFFTGLLAFALSHRNLAGRKFYTMMCLIPMYFSGGLIPIYFVIKWLGLVNTFLVYIIPLIINLWNMILMRTYFQGIPTALEESARIDGASYFTVFFRIIMPISTPIMATIALYIGVFHWNSWFDAAIYVTRQELKPMQSILLSVISEAKFAERLAETAGGAAAADMTALNKSQKVNVRSISMATMFVTIIPIITMYPFLQRYFIKGVMIGSLKG